jgi:hypothetical protein
MDLLVLEDYIRCISTEEILYKCFDFRKRNTINWTEKNKEYAMIKQGNNRPDHFYCDKSVTI